MGWFKIFQLVLQIAAFIARRLEEDKVRKAFADALLVAIDKRVDAAVGARADVLDGRVQPDDADKYRRD